MAKKSIRLAINGFGRIGRAAFKIALDHPRLAVVGINDLTDPGTLAHLLRYDTIYGRFDRPVAVRGGSLVVSGKAYPVFAQKDPAQLPWEKLKVDVVIESTGRFTDQAGASAHLRAGAKRVVISAPVKDGGEIPTYVLGVNAGGKQKAIKGKIISNASCTTNCIAPVAAVLSHAFGIAKATMTTIHSYTADQMLVDGPHRDLRRARSAAENIVPTSTGASIAAAEALPALKGLFDGLSIRVPTPVVSLADFSIVTKRKVTVERVNDAFREAARQPRWKGILEVTDEPLVSSDFIGNSASAIVDLPLTQVVGGDLVKVIAWYDNEWGYSCRLVEMAEEVGLNLRGD